jgi:hypothetical protein
MAKDHETGGGQIDPEKPCGWNDHDQDNRRYLHCSSFR